MKKVFTIIIFIFCFLNAFCQSNNNTVSTNEEKILEITYDHGGAWDTNDTILKISKDSTFYKANKYDIQANHRGNYVYKKQKTDPKEWFELIASINLSDFDKEINSRNRREVDGSDTQISIRTSKKIHFLIIGNNNNAIKAFLEKVHLELKRCE